MHDICDRLSDEAIERNREGDFETRNFLREVRNDIERRGSGLFVIEQSRTDKERVFWNCSTEHGCGWNPGHPKQAFTKSELSREIFRMVDKGLFSTLIIRELVL